MAQRYKSRTRERERRRVRAPCADEPRQSSTESRSSGSRATCSGNRPPKLCAAKAHKGCARARHSLDARASDGCARFGETRRMCSRRVVHERRRPGRVEPAPQRQVSRRVSKNLGLVSFVSRVGHDGSRSRDDRSRTRRARVGANRDRPKSDSILPPRSKSNGTIPTRYILSLDAGAEHAVGRPRRYVTEHDGRALGHALQSPRVRRTAGAAVSTERARELCREKQEHRDKARFAAVVWCLDFFLKRILYTPYGARRARPKLARAYVSLLVLFHAPRKAPEREREGRLCAVFETGDGEFSPYG